MQNSSKWSVETFTAKSQARTPKVSKQANLAAVDREQRVGVEIVTSRDCSQFRGGIWSSVSSYHTKALAESIAEGIRTQAKQELRVGVAYRTRPGQRGSSVD